MDKFFAAGRTPEADHESAALSYVITYVLHVRLQHEVVGSVVSFVVVLMVDAFIRSRQRAVDLPPYQMMLVAVPTAIPLTGIIIRSDYKFVGSVFHMRSVHHEVNRIKTGALPIELPRIMLTSTDQTRPSQLLFGHR